MRKTPRDTYQDILASKPEELDMLVLSVLIRYRGKRNTISRILLVEKVFGIMLDRSEDLSRNAEDRLIRLAIARLQETYPIIGSSGFSGYYYAATQDELTEYIREIESRALKLLEKKRNLEQISVKEFGPQYHLPGV
jgi:hypothetical protein